MNTIFDKRVLYLSICCTAIRAILAYTKYFSKNSIFSVFQIIIGILFIYLIYKEYEKDPKYSGKYYILYLLGAFFVLISLNGFMFSLTRHLIHHHHKLLYIIDFGVKFIWAFMNAFLFQLFRQISYNN